MLVCIVSTKGDISRRASLLEIDTKTMVRSCMPRAREALCGGVVAKQCLSEIVPGCCPWRFVQDSAQPVLYMVSSTQPAVSEGATAGGALT